MLTGEVGLGGTVELTLLEVFDEVCPSEEEEGELWPTDEVNWEGLRRGRRMEIDGFIKIGGKRKGNRNASPPPPSKKASKSSAKDQVTENMY